MGRVLLEGGIIVLLVLVGISIFIPDDGTNVDKIIVEFEESIESGSIVDDGEIKDVEIRKSDDSTFVAKVNCKIANSIVNGLNSLFDVGIKFLRKVIN